VLQLFVQKHGASSHPIRAFYSAGRVNLIGEHIDYNGGFVLPAAIGLGCTIYCRLNDKNCLNVAYTTTDFEGSIDYTKLDSYRDKNYLNYIAGVCIQLQDIGIQLVGIDVLYDITVPFGSGLSSSAAIEVATAYMLQSIYNNKHGIAKPIDCIQLAVICQKAENNFVGVNCGIMDQFASAMGKDNNAILLNCSTLEYKYISGNMDGLELCIINTNKPHDLTTSKYNERRQECESALNWLNTKSDKPIKDLCSLTPTQFESLAQGMNSVLYNRAKHCVYENDRVVNAVDAFGKGDIQLFGNLMLQSHDSLKDLYEVSCVELDTIVDILKAQSYCKGVRMTGGGFGGCCVAIVAKDNRDKIQQLLDIEYPKKTGLNCSIYYTNMSDGAKEIFVS